MVGLNEEDIHTDELDQICIGPVAAFANYEDKQEEVVQPEKKQNPIWERFRQVYKEKTISSPSKVLDIEGRHHLDMI